MKVTQIIKLRSAKWLDDYKVELQFEDNVTRQIDFKNFLFTHPHPQHDKYKKTSYFRKFKIERNNLVWGKNWDLEFDLWRLYQGINP